MTEQNYYEFYMKIAGNKKSGIKIRTKKKTLTHKPSMKNKNSELNAQEKKPDGC